MTRAPIRTYDVEAAASLAWIAAVVVLLAWGLGFLYVQDRAAQSACESIAAQIRTDCVTKGSR